MSVGFPFGYAGMEAGCPVEAGLAAVPCATLGVHLTALVAASVVQSQSAFEAVAFEQSTAPDF